MGRCRRPYTKSAGQLIRNDCTCSAKLLANSAAHIANASVAKVADSVRSAECSRTSARNQISVRRFRFRRRAILADGFSLKHCCNGNCWHRRPPACHRCLTSARYKLSGPLQSEKSAQELTAIRRRSPASCWRKMPVSTGTFGGAVRAVRQPGRDMVRILSANLQTHSVTSFAGTRAVGRPQDGGGMQQSVLVSCLLPSHSFVVMQEL